MMLIALLMFWIFRSLAKVVYVESEGVPAGIGRFFEPIVLYIRDDIARPNIGEKKHGKYMGFLLTVFFLYLVSKPCRVSLHLGVNVTGNIAVTFGLALLLTFCHHEPYRNQGLLAYTFLILWAPP